MKLYKNIRSTLSETKKILLEQTKGHLDSGKAFWEEGQRFKQEWEQQIFGFVYEVKEPTQAFWNELLDELLKMELDDSYHLQILEKERKIACWEEEIRELQESFLLEKKEAFQQKEIFEKIESLQKELLFAKEELLAFQTKYQEKQTKERVLRRNEIIFFLWFVEEMPFLAKDLGEIVWKETQVIWKEIRLELLSKELHENEDIRRYWNQIFEHFWKTLPREMVWATSKRTLTYFSQLLMEIAGSEGKEKALLLLREWMSKAREAWGKEESKIKGLLAEPRIETEKRKH